MTTEIKILRLPHACDLPQRATIGSAGFDLSAAITQKLEIAPGARVAIPTGIALELPLGFEGQIRPRSGLARKHGITVLNSPGTIDSDYRGEILVLLVHLGEQPVEIARGERIAQLVIARVETAITWHEVDELGDSRRGAGGFGSSGR
jgi:dUTP pyrophosphatase